MLGGVALVGGSQQEAPKIEPKADQYLKAMSNYLAGLKTYSFQVEEFFDDVQDDGQKLQLSNQRHVSLSCLRVLRLCGHGELLVLLRRQDGHRL